ncbi:MAG: type II toxin-antitoxin system death-on-curing family toxin [Candidatus Korobacteraceae bacterium]
MPINKPFRLTAAFIEGLHDEGIAITWPGTEPVEEYECLDLNLLESAAKQAFQAGFGVEFYPTIYDKAACLFFLIAGGHIFRNGNKRTAVLALDQFLTANSYYLFMSNPAVKKLAEDTAEYRLRFGDHKSAMAEIAKKIKDNSFPFRLARIANPSVYRHLHKLKRLIREDPLNHPDARPRQAPPI